MRCKIEAIRMSKIFKKGIKRTIDIVGSTSGIVLLSPVFLYLAYKVRQDGGPAFYGHKRLGKDGKTFKCWKFRSMVPNAGDVLTELLENDPAAREEWNNTFKLKNDPRITKIGDFLRKTSLDEIPQLFNVLKGEMSLVGPRPIVFDEIKYYNENIKYYYSVKPGVTGLWQVSGRSDASYRKRVKLDNFYVRNFTILRDIQIMIKTVFVVLKREGAY